MRTQKIIPILFLVLVGPIFAFAAKSDSRYKTFKNETYGYSVEYPSWRKVVDWSEDHSSIVFDDGNPSVNHNNLAVGVSENFFNTSNLNELVKSYVEMIQGSAMGFPIGEPKVDVKNVKIQKIKAKQLTYLDNERVLVSTIIFLKDNKVWSLGGPVKDKDFKRFISSFKFIRRKIAEETAEKIGEDKLIPIEIVISPEVSKRLKELGWNDEGAREVAKRARASTVCFITEYDSCRGATGFVTQGGLIATCGHCTPHVHDDEKGTTDLNKFRIKTITGEVLAAEVLEKSDIADLALVKVISNISALPPPLLTERSHVKDEPVIMVGHPDLTGYWTIILGKIASVNPDAKGKGWTIVDISNAPGNSGSPVLNKNGEVVGILSHGSGLEDVPDIYPLDLTFNLTLTSPTFGIATSGKAESTIILQDMINRHQKEWIPETDSKTYAYLERKTPPLPKKSTQKSTAERLQELNWSETDARALAEKVRASTICLRPPSELTHCITGWVAAPNIIATCAHCVHSHGKDGDALVARTISNAILSVELLKKSDTADLAIFKVISNTSALPPPLALGSASVGDPVVMVGHIDLGNWVTVLGEVSSIRRGGKPYREGGKWRVDNNEYRADIAHFNGNSGSAVVNRKGEVIGIHTGGTWENNPPEPYQPNIILDIYKARTDFSTIEDSILLSPMLKKYR